VQLDILWISILVCVDRNGGHLWEFIRRLLSLSDANSERIIQWENKSEGVFRFLNPDAVAELWGKEKHNRRTAMDYPKLSRALRYQRHCSICYTQIDTPIYLNYIVVVIVDLILR